MKKKDRVRVCGNLQKLMEKKISPKLREHLRRQYVSTASRINEKQPTGVGAGRLDTCTTNSITVSLSGFGGKSNAS
ncbi:hypothetical protein BSK59_08360 [Paenibacillus odorifer]|uniref:hypothetical protein n=1 Tax=Paenibacillus TaxID=44249 RepID=UPI00096E8243|nr:hypothetical protein [Paenibacillus odorifer]OME58187.1 hypothetical protein BSK59_08360 [Paenibacillus odorifer]